MVLLKLNYLENKSGFIDHLLNRRELEQEQARQAYFQKTLEGKTVYC